EKLEQRPVGAAPSDCRDDGDARQSYRGYRCKRDDDVVIVATDALARTGREASFGLSGGAADANVFNERGLQCLNLANGMADIHMPDERIAITDLERMVDVTVALVEVARAS